MQKTLELSLISAGGVLLKEVITDIYIPAHLGKAGILFSHRPYISGLVKGEISFTDDKGKKHFMYIKKGVIKVSNNRILIITNSLEKGTEINPEEVENKLRDIEKKIKGSFTEETGPEELEKALNEKKEWVIKNQILTKILKNRK